MHKHNITIVQYRHKSGSNKLLFCLKGKAGFNSKIEVQVHFQSSHQLLDMRAKGESVIN